MFCNIKSISSALPEINIISEAMDNKVTTIFGVVGTVALLIYFGKLNEEQIVKIILAVICAFSPNRNRGIVHQRIIIGKWF